jgi:hypothetical protein
MLSRRMSLKTPSTSVNGNRQHRAVSRLFSGVSHGGSEKVTRKSSVPSAVLFSAPLISATVGDKKFGEQV